MMQGLRALIQDEAAPQRERGVEGLAGTGAS